MTKVDFYILEGNSGNREQTACRIADKAYRLGHGVYIHTADPGQAKRLDELLWTFKQNSFVPHGIEGESPDPEVAVLISHHPELTDSTQTQRRQVLINLAQEIPMFFSSFERVAEVIGQDNENKASGRQRYKFYRDRGYSLDTHTLT
ncbi:MAG TPA: DNA polymerase III subunit chi [Candidatus Tenderia electrophaga]|uniref:DNA polymerase III subunit chi n=1 Tax=Candidatus Tenderia electrophaga TaxID=1748243 RepID=A0A832JAG0_9GAMM|nr:DNA polymerase III subunit chi [Candidatus Tenderia electrophaga]